MTSAEYVMKESAKSGLYAAVFSMTIKVLPDLCKCIGNTIENEKIDSEDLKKLGLDAISSGSAAYIQGSITEHWLHSANLVLSEKFIKMPHLKW